MGDTAYPKSNSYNWLRWAARACLLASAISILIVSYFFYAPYIDIPPSPQIGQTVWNGGFLLAITGFAWRWPGAGGIIAMLYVCFELFLSIRMYAFDPTHPRLLIPLPVYLVLYGTFLVGGILHLIVGLRQKIAFPYPEFQTDKQIRWAARITTFASIIVLSIIFWFIHPTGFIIFFGVPALVIAGLAWLWPGVGGVLIVLLCAWVSHLLISSNYSIGDKTAGLIFIAIFLAGGVLHLVMAWRQRKRT